LEEKIKEEKTLKKMDRGQLSKRKNTSMDALEHLMENNEGHVVKALKTWVKWS